MLMLLALGKKRVLNLNSNARKKAPRLRKKKKKGMLNLIIKEKKKSSKTKSDLFLVLPETGAVGPIVAQGKGEGDPNPQM